jgi:hypothetical protein
MSKEMPQHALLQVKSNGKTGLVRMSLMRIHKWLLLTLEFHINLRFNSAINGSLIPQPLEEKSNGRDTPTTTPDISTGHPRPTPMTLEPHTFTVLVLLNFQQNQQQRQLLQNTKLEVKKNGKHGLKLTLMPLTNRQPRPTLNFHMHPLFLNKKRPMFNSLLTIHHQPEVRSNGQHTRETTLHTLTGEILRIFMNPELHITVLRFNLRSKLHPFVEKSNGKTGLKT